MGTRAASQKDRRVPGCGRRQCLDPGRESWQERAVVAAWTATCVRGHLIRLRAPCLPLGGGCQGPTSKSSRSPRAADEMSGDFLRSRSLHAAHRAGSARQDSPSPASRPSRLPWGVCSLLLPRAPEDLGPCSQAVAPQMKDSSPKRRRVSLGTQPRRGRAGGAASSVGLRGWGFFC